MHRLVIALTTLLTLIGVAVIGAYLFIFGPGIDHAASLAPENSLAYVSVYLSPSTGQEMNFGDLLTKLPGFSDRDQLGDKLDQIVQRTLADAGLDYHADVKPWLGDEIALAILPATGRTPSVAGGEPVLLLGVRDQAGADAAIGRIAARSAATVSTETYRQVTIRVLSGASTVAGRFAIVDSVLVVAPETSLIHAVIDAAQGRAGSLADRDAFRTAMRELPADRLASAYLDIGGLASAGGAGIGTTGIGAAGLALVAKPGGLQLIGSAPYGAGAAAASLLLPTAGEASSLADWMPASTEAELVFFGAQQTFTAIAAQLGSIPGGQDAAQALTQLRALAALGLGIDLDRDLLPLFDRDAAVAVQELSGTTPHGQLLLHPSDPGAAETSLRRMADALRSRGSAVVQQQVGSTTVTVMTVPQVGEVAYAVRDGVVVAGLSAADVAAALTAHDAGSTLGASAEYRAAFDVAGGRGGTELYLDGTRAVALILGMLNQRIDALPADVRDILTHVGALAVTVPARQNQIEIHATVTVH